MVAFGEWSFGEWSPSGIGRSEIGRSGNGHSENGRSENIILFHEILQNFKFYFAKVGCEISLKFREIQGNLAKKKVIFVCKISRNFG
jgi:hypothetical protein